MIEFQKTTESGQHLKAYTHRAYLSKKYNEQIELTEKKYKKRADTAFFGSSLLSFWAFNEVPGLKKLIENKVSWKGRYLVLSLCVGFANSLLVSIFGTKNLKKKHETLLKKQTFPAWSEKDRVVNPDRVFFELDDSRQNHPNIWHSGITQQQIKRLVPDFIVGNPYKPSLPIQQRHH